MAADIDVLVGTANKLLGRTGPLVFDRIREKQQGAACLLDALVRGARSTRAPSRHHDRSLTGSDTGNGAEHGGHRQAGRCQ